MSTPVTSLFFFKPIIGGEGCLRGGRATGDQGGLVRPNGCPATRQPLKHQGCLVWHRFHEKRASRSGGESERALCPDVCVPFETARCDRDNIFASRGQPDGHRRANFKWEQCQSEHRHGWVRFWSCVGLCWQRHGLPPSRPCGLVWASSRRGSEASRSDG